MQGLLGGPGAPWGSSGQRALLSRVGSFPRILCFPQAGRHPEAAVPLAFSWAARYSLASFLGHRSSARGRLGSEPWSLVSEVSLSPVLVPHMCPSPLATISGAQPGDLQGHRGPRSRNLFRGASVGCLSRSPGVFRK